MKTKYVRVNKCERCGEKAGHFIWTTSAQVNAGIYTMYPKGKICLACMKELRASYPDKKPEYKAKECSICKGKIVAYTEGIGEGVINKEYCEDCGVVIE